LSTLDAADVLCPLPSLLSSPVYRRRHNKTTKYKQVYRNSDSLDTGSNEPLAASANLQKSSCACAYLASNCADKCSSFVDGDMLSQLNRRESLQPIEWTIINTTIVSSSTLEIKTHVLSVHGSDLSVLTVVRHGPITHSLVFTSFFVHL
jgi:hypothetical protein